MIAEHHWVAISCLRVRQYISELDRLSHPARYARPAIRTGEVAQAIELKRRHLELTVAGAKSECRIP